MSFTYKSILPTPEQIKGEFPLASEFSKLKAERDKAIADVLLMNDEPTPQGEDYEIFDPNHTWKRKIVTDYYAKELLVPIFRHGKCVYNSPDIEAIRNYCKEQVDTLWDEVKRFENPHDYYVDLSPKLWEVKHKLLSEHK